VLLFLDCCLITVFQKQQEKQSDALKIVIIVPSALRLDVQDSKHNKCMKTMLEIFKNTVRLLLLNIQAWENFEIYFPI